MLAYRRDDVRELNQAAHALMHRSGRLGREAATFGDREFRVRRPGRLPTQRRPPRRPQRHPRHDRRPRPRRRSPSATTPASSTGLPFGYAAEHLEHGYALTGHAAQGATFDRAYVLLRDQGALQEWGYVACTRARVETRLYLADHDGLERETPLRDPDPAAPPERAARALERSAAEPLALDQTTRRHDVNARLVTRRQQELEQQRARTAEQLSAAGRELKQLGWWHRGDRRFELQAEIALRQAALRGIDETRAKLELTPPTARRLPPPARDRDDLTPTRSLRPEPPGRRTLEPEPPSLGLEL